MVDLKALQNELQQARQARIAAQSAADALEDEAEQMRRTPPAGLWPQLRRGPVGLPAFVFES